MLPGNDSLLVSVFIHIVDRCKNHCSCKNRCSSWLASVQPMYMAPEQFNGSRVDEKVVAAAGWAYAAQLARHSASLTCRLQLPA
jgi:hypothetical protein